MGIWVIVCGGSQTTASLKWLQFLQTCGTFLLPPIICAAIWDEQHKPFAWLKMDKGADGTFFVLAIGIMICAIPAINFLADLNGRIHLPECLDSIEQKLRKDDFLNDTRFCHAFVHDKVEYQRWGRLKIQAGLRALQLPESAIREAMDTIDEKRYKENLCDLVALRRTDAPDKRLRFLLQRGFTYDEIINYA